MIDEIQINGCRLVRGDCIEILSKFVDENLQADACITDPPYNISGYDDKKEIGWLKSNLYWKDKKKFKKINEGWDKFTNGSYENFTKMWLNLVCKIVKPNGNLIIFGTYHNIYKIGYALQKMDKKIVNSIIWYKRNAFPNITQRMFCESTEQIIWAVNNSQKMAKNWVFNYEILKKMNDGKQMRNMWDVPQTPISEKKFGRHPSQKPIKVVERLVLGCTNENDLIIDPFMGSGTIPLVAKMYKRESIGIEMNKKYFEISKRRIQSLKYNQLKLV